MNTRNPQMMLASVAAIIVLTFVAAACSSGSKSKVATSPTTTATIAPTTTVAPPATIAPGTTVTTPSAPTTVGVRSCTTTMLTATISGSNGAAGTIYSNLIFKNTSSSPCTLAGYPGVSFVDCCGHQIGAAVPRDPTTASVTVTLPAGGSAGAVFAYHDAYVGTVTGCQSTASNGLRVYPPDQTTSLFVPDPLQVCANTATNGTASIQRVTTLSNLPN